MLNYRGKQVITNQNAATVKTLTKKRSDGGPLFLVKPPSNFHLKNDNNNSGHFCSSVSH